MTKLISSSIISGYPDKFTNSSKFYKAYIKYEMRSKYKNNGLKDYNRPA